MHHRVSRNADAEVPEHVTSRVTSSSPAFSHGFNNIYCDCKQEEFGDYTTSSCSLEQTPRGPDTGDGGSPGQLENRW